MSTFIKADDVFRDLPMEVKKAVFKIAEGRVVYFPKQSSNRKKISKVAVCISYARGYSYGSIGNTLGLSKMRICQIVNRERQNFSKKRVEYWRSQGLSLREIGRLFKKSHEAVR